MADAPTIGETKTNDKGQVAVYTGKGWDIYDNAGEAAAGIRAQPDLHQSVLGSLMTRINEGYKSNIAQPVTETLNKVPYVGSYASAMVPQNLPELAATGAAMALPGLMPARLAARPLMAAASRVAAPALAAMGVAGATGEDLTTEGLKAGLGGLAGEAFTGLANWGKELTTKGGFIRQGANDANNLVSAIRKDVPGLNSVIAGVKDLFEGRVGGQRALGDAFETLKKDANAVFGKTLITFPMVEEGRIITKQMPVADAVGAVSSLKEMGRKAGDAAKNSNDFQKSNEVAGKIQAQATQAEAALMQVFQKKDPNLASAYVAANENYKKGLKVLKLLGDSGAIQSSPTGAYLDNGQLARYMLENIKDYPTAIYDAIWRVATRTKPGATIDTGVSDALTRIGGGERIFIPHSANILPGVSVPIPSLLRLHRAGTPASVLGQGIAGRIPQSLVNVLGQRLGSGVLGE